MKKCLSDALAIDELRVTLENISHDDDRDMEDYSREELVAEANYVLSCYFEGGHMSNDELNSDDGEIRSSAKKQVKMLQNYIKKYS